MSKLKVVSIERNETQSGENVVDRLKQALAMAEDGLISNVVICAQLHNGDVMDCWANNSNPFLVVGGLESVKLEFMNSCIEKR